MSLLERNPAAAEQQARKVLAVLPEDARALCVVAAARRRLGDPQTARVLLERLVAAFPKTAFAHLELGLTLAALGESAASLEALRRAVDLRRDAPQAWLALSDQLVIAGDTDTAATAFAEHLRVSARDARVLAAIDAIREDRLRDALAILRAYLLEVPGDTMALRMLGETAFRLGYKDDAEELLAQCVRMDANAPGACYSYATVLFQQHKARDALAQLKRLRAMVPHEPKMLQLTAACMIQTADFAGAAAVAADLLRNHAEQANFWLCRGQVERIYGHTESAISDFRQAMRLRPGMGLAYWCVADIKGAAGRFDADDLAMMRRQVENPALEADDHIHLHYALGRALEEQGEWAESFQHYAAGARLRRAAVPYDADQNTVLVNRIIASQTPEDFAVAEGAGCCEASPIFIVGLPRAGSTLVEQILASHPDVEATLELPELMHITTRLSRAARRQSGEGYFSALTRMTPAERRALGEEYLARAAHYRKTGRPRFIDKMPPNFFHIGAIRLLLPRARVIDVRRQPMAACFANFKQLFTRGQDFTYGLDDLGRYYRDYLRLMAHTDTILPGFVHRVVYEDLVEDTEAEIRRLLAFCGLEFHPGCLRYWEGARTISTHSAEQVRGPIFRGGLEHWRHYEAWLGPLRAALGEA